MLDAVRRRYADRVGYGARFGLTISVLGLCFVFGGGSRQWLPSEFICQIAGLLCLAVAFMRLAQSEGAERLWPEIGLVVIIVALPLSQIVPLPPFVWSALPGREALVKQFGLTQGSLPWQPISVYKDATYQALFSLMAPLAVFVSTLRLGYDERRAVVVFVLAFGCVSMALALLQMAQGPDSPLRFYTITNVGLPVGFFANRNHFAAFLYCMLPLSAAWIITLAIERRSARRSSAGDPRRHLAYYGTVAVFAACLLMQGLIHSRAGLSITILAGVLSLVLALPFRNVGIGRRAVQGLVVAFVIAALLTGYYAISSILQQFDHDPIDDARFTILKGSTRALSAFFPIGSGFGTFDVVYRRFEPARFATSEYVNRAHDDVIEVLIEGGLFAVVAALLFLIWFVKRHWSVWRLRDMPVVDASLARAGAIIPLLLIAHSVLDYPLRTEAVMALFAFACALTVPPLDPGTGLPGRTVSAARPNRQVAATHRQRPAGP